MAKINQRSGPAATAMLGLGVYRPERVVTNDEICEVLDSSDEWIQSRSGIRTRRYANDEETLVEMATRASRAALEAAGIEAEQLGTVILATSTHAQHTPAAAPIVADQLGSRAAAFDVSAGCAGFCHGVAVGSDLVRGGTAEHVLVVGVDKLSDFTDPHDRSTAFLFADGAGAVVIGPSDEVGIAPTVWGSDGGQADVIRSKFSWLDVRAGQAPQRLVPDEVAVVAAAEPVGEETPPDDTWPYLEQAGQTVFRWAVWQMAPVAQRALDAAGITAADLDVFVAHQANGRIIDAMVKQLKLPDSVHVARDIVEMGNTSAASVPLAMERALADGEAPSGGLALLIGYGAGLSYAAQVVRLP